MMNRFTIVLVFLTAILSQPSTAYLASFTMDTKEQWDNGTYVSTNDIYSRYPGEVLLNYGADGWYSGYFGSFYCTGGLSLNSWDTTYVKFQLNPSSWTSNVNYGTLRLFVNHHFYGGSTPPEGDYLNYSIYKVWSSWTDIPCSSSPGYSTFITTGYLGPLGAYECGGEPCGGDVWDNYYYNFTLPGGNKTQIQNSWGNPNGMAITAIHLDGFGINSRETDTPPCLDINFTDGSFQTVCLPKSNPTNGTHTSGANQLGGEDVGAFVSFYASETEPAGTYISYRFRGKADINSAWGDWTSWVNYTSGTINLSAMSELANTTYIQVDSYLYTNTSGTTPVLDSYVVVYELVQCEDKDGDGYEVRVGNCVLTTPEDCNDSDPNISPGTNEICNNNIDDDCDQHVDCRDDECIGQIGPKGGICCKIHHYGGWGLCSGYYYSDDDCNTCWECGPDLECIKMPNYRDDCFFDDYDVNGKCALCVNGNCTKDYEGTYYERVNGSTYEGYGICRTPSNYVCPEVNVTFDSTPTVQLVSHTYITELKRDVNYIGIVIQNNEDSYSFNGYVLASSSCCDVSVHGYGSQFDEFWLSPQESIYITIIADLSSYNGTNCPIHLYLYQDCFGEYTLLADYATINATLPSLTEDNYNLSITPTTWIVNLTDTGNSSQVCTDTKKTFTINNTGNEVVSDINIEFTGGLQDYYLIDNPIQNFKLYPNQSVNFTLYLFIDNTTQSSESKLRLTWGNGSSKNVTVTYIQVGGEWAEKPNVSSYDWSVILTGRGRINHGWYSYRRGENSIILKLPKTYNLSEVENASLVYSARSDIYYAPWWWNYPYYYWPWYHYSFEGICPTETLVYLNRNTTIVMCHEPNGEYIYDIPDNYTTSYGPWGWYWWFYPYYQLPNTTMYYFYSNLSIVNYTNDLDTLIYSYRAKGTTEVAAGLRFNGFGQGAYCTDLVCNVTEVNETSCSDGIDNDCNGFVDCYDLHCCALDNSTGCLGTYYCKPAENCTDGIDDDGDGLTDCNDTADCCNLPLCSTADACGFYEVYGYVNSTTVNITELMDGEKLPDVGGSYARKMNLRGTHRFEAVNATGLRSFMWYNTFNSDLNLSLITLRSGSNWLAASGFQGNATFYVPYDGDCLYLFQCNGTSGCSSGGSYVYPSRITANAPFSCIVENVTGTSIENRASPPSVELKQGFNLISLPVLPENLSVLSALSGLQFGVDYDVVYRYNTSTEQFEVFRNISWLNQFTELELGKGYYIYMLRAKNLTITGTPITSQQSINLTGNNKWNLAGWSSLSTKSIASSVSGLNLDADFSAIELYNASSSNFIGYYDANENFNTLHEFSSYNGYWFYVLRNSSWGYVP